MDELQISGKRFISSRRIARENGYTSDYIGQLIRGSKIIGQKVGRAWYVDAASFEKYLGGEGASESVRVQEEAPVSVAEIVTEEVVQPTPEPAPVKEEVAVESQIVEEEIKEVLEKKEEEIISSEPISEPMPEPAVVVEVAKEAVAEHVPLRLVKKEEPAELKKEVGGLRYFSEEAPALPEIRSNKKESRLQPVSLEEETTLLAVAPEKKVRTIRPLHVAGLATLGITIFVFSAVVSSVVSVNLSIEAGNAASTYYSVDW